jgi:predicted  nucleic acid-binding Zn-ribbon protein
MSSENESLHRRISVLEDAELEVLDQLEQAESARAEHAADGLRAELARATAARDAELPATLSALYERKRSSSGGVGAAALVDGRCGGCRLQLNVSELTAIRTAPADEVLECGRILVRQ